MKHYFLKPCLAIAVMAMSALNAQAKPATPPPGPDPGTPCITMTVINAGDPVLLGMRAAKVKDSVWIVNGTDTTKVDVGDWEEIRHINSKTNTIKLYGNLAGFNCNGNLYLTGLSFSEGLTNLTRLRCDWCNLDSLDVSKLTNLEWLWCGNNPLTKLNVRGLTNLEWLWCNFTTTLTELDVTGLTNLRTLECANNQLTELDVAGLTNLKYLVCKNNKIKYLDLTGTGVSVLEGEGYLHFDGNVVNAMPGSNDFLQQPGYNIFIRLNPDNSYVKDIKPNATYGGLTAIGYTLPTPVINRTVQIISEGLETSPKATAGFHYVAGHKDFTFTVYTDKDITVTTNRNDVVGDGILLSQNKEAGTWIVTIKQISTNMVINVSETKTENGEITANATIAGEDAVWSSNGMVHIRTSSSGVAYIYNVRGSLCKQVTVSGDASFAMPEGFYIVRLNGKSYKIKN